MATNTIKDYQINTFTAGMDMDTTIDYLDKTKYRYAENVRIVTNDNGTTGVLQNSDGVEAVYDIYLEQDEHKRFVERIIHVDVIRNYAIVFTEHEASVSRPYTYTRLVDGVATTFTYTSPFNNIYRLNFDVELTTHDNIYEEPLFQTLILRGSLNIQEPISSVTKWEDFDNVKIYWSDGTNPIRVISVVPELTYENVAYHPYDPINRVSDYWDYYLDIDAGSVDITPNLVNASFTFDRFGSGGLKVGAYQYSYQLYTDFGGETILAPLTDIIYITPSAETGIGWESYKGDYSNVTSGKSIVLKLQSTSLNIFDKVRLIRVYYENLTDTPAIDTIFETEINGTTVYLEDIGGGPLAELTTSTTENIERYQFTAKVVESKDNILFAGDITEITGAGWDLDDYEARAFRFDANGVSYITDNVLGTIELNRADIIADNINIPLTHDCMPSDADGNFTNTAYKYGNTKDVAGTPTPVLGGVGPNISYEIVTIDLIEDETALTVQTTGGTFNGQVVNQNKTTIETSAKHIAGLVCRTGYVAATLEPGSGSFTETDTETVSIKPHTGFLNYQNPFISSSFKSLQRDETYRYGIVFYNMKGIASPVKWIADIKMPTNSEIPYVKWNKQYSYVSHDGNGGNIQTTTLAYNPSCITSIMGLKFTVKEETLPEGCTAYEIVRVKRTEEDRYVKYSVALANTYYNHYEPSKIYPLWYMTSSGRNGWATLNGWDQYGSSNYDPFHPVTMLQQGKYFFSPTPGLSDGFSRPGGYAFRSYGTPGGHSWQCRPVIYDKAFILSCPEIVLAPDFVAEKLRAGNVQLKGSINLGSKIENNKALYGGSGYYGFYMDNFNDTCSNDRIMATPIVAGNVTNNLMGTVLNGNYPAPSKGGARPYSQYYDQENSRTYNYFVETGCKGTDQSGSYKEPFLDSGNTVGISKYYYPYFGVKFIKSGTTPANEKLNVDLVPSATYKDITDVSFLIKDAKASGMMDPLNNQALDSLAVSESFIANKAYRNVSLMNRRRAANCIATPGTVLIPGPIRDLLLMLEAKTGVPGRVRDQDGWFYYTSRYGTQHGPSIVIEGDIIVDGSQVRGVGQAQTHSSDTTSTDLITINGISIYNVVGSEGVQYGGRTHESRQYNVYESIGGYKIVTDGTDKILFNGDIYVTLFDYSITSTAGWPSPEIDPDLHDDSKETYVINSVYTGAYIPLETSVNTKLMHGAQFSRTGEKQLHHGPGSYQGITQANHMYLYNNVYSQMHSSVKHFLSKLDVSQDNKRFDTRIIHSQPKTNDEASDNWIQFRQADHLDLDTRFGPVTSLKTFKNRLFFWQEQGFGITSVNERSLIQDGNTSALVLGTGDVLTRYDYITNENGSKYDCSGNIVTTDNGIYWYDQLKNEIIVYANDTQSLSKIKGVQTYLNASNEHFLDRMCTVYDSKYNEVLFTFRTEEYETPYFS